MQEVNSIDNLYKNTFFKLKGFIKTKFLGVKDPLYQKYITLSNIKNNLQTNPVSRRFITQNNSLSPYFAKELYFIYQYIKPLNEKVDWTSLFNSDKFPLFVMNYFSTPKQKEWLKILISPSDMHLIIEKEGIKKSRILIKKVFEQYKDSFTFYQIHKINHILSLGMGLYTLINYDFTNLLSLFYPELIENGFTITENIKEIKSVPFNETDLMLDEFLNYISIINMESDYYEFIKLYGLFLGKKIIAQKDFELFIKGINSFLENNVILNIVQLIKQDELVRPSLPNQIYENLKINDVIKAISKRIRENHFNATNNLRSESLDSILDYLFEKTVVQKIINFQGIINTYITGNENIKTHSAFLVVLSAFKDKVFDVSIKKTFDYLVQNIIFVSEEFKKDLFHSYHSIIESINSSKILLTELNKAHTAKMDLDELDITANKMIADFIHNSALFSSFLETIIASGNVDLSLKIKLNISEEELSELIVSLKTATNIFSKLQYYLKIGIASITKISKNIL